MRGVCEEPRGFARVGNLVIQRNPIFDLNLISHGTFFSSMKLLRKLFFRLLGRTDWDALMYPPHKKVWNPNYAALPKHLPW
jgi:hypothetical protein